MNILIIENMSSIYTGHKKHFDPSEEITNGKFNEVQIGNLFGFPGKAGRLLNIKKPGKRPFYKPDSKKENGNRSIMCGFLRENEYEPELIDRLFLKHYVSTEKLTAICRKCENEGLGDLDEICFLQLRELTTKGGYYLKEQQIIKHQYLFENREKLPLRKTEKCRVATSELLREDFPELLDIYFKYN